SPTWTPATTSWPCPASTDRTLPAVVSRPPATRWRGGGSPPPAGPGLRQGISGQAQRDTSPGRCPPPFHDPAAGPAGPRRSAAPSERAGPLPWAWGLDGGRIRPPPASLLLLVQP